MRPKASWVGLIYRTNQHYHRQWLKNTEWSNSRIWAWARDRWLWRERLWETEVFKVRVGNEHLWAIKHNTCPNHWYNCVIICLPSCGYFLQKNYPVCTLENVVSSAISNLHIQYLFFANNSLISGLNRIENMIYIVLNYYSVQSVLIPSVLWHCWFGHLACKNRPRNDL